MAGDLDKFETIGGGTTYRFLSMSIPPRRKEQLIVEARVGVDDYAVWIDSRRGEPGTVVTAADTDDFERDARIYNAMIGIVHEVTFNGEKLPDRYMIQHVESRKGPLLYGKQVIATAAPNAMIYATWSLFAIEPIN